VKDISVRNTAPEVYVSRPSRTDEDRSQTRLPKLLREDHQLLDVIGLVEVDRENIVTHLDRERPSARDRLTDREPTVGGVVFAEEQGIPARSHDAAGEGQDQIRVGTRGVCGIHPSVSLEPRHTPRAGQP
jgi:hypothetical protein